VEIKSIVTEMIAQLKTICAAVEEKDTSENTALEMVRRKKVVVEDLERKIRRKSLTLQRRVTGALGRPASTCRQRGRPVGA
jgi:hypothetical protein